MIQEKDLKVGMKVKIPKTKTLGVSFTNERFQEHLKNTDKDYLTIYGFDSYEVSCDIHTKDYGRQNWSFALEDLELYEEPFVLPEKWYMKGSEEFADWVKDYEDKNNTVINIIGNYKQYYYPRNFPLIWIADTDEPEYRAEITFSQFKQHVLKEETMKLPTENFGIKVVNHNAKDILQWFKDKEYNIGSHYGDAENDSVYWLRKDTINVECDYPTGVPDNIKIYTLEEIKQIENQTKNNMETKELLGYKLIKPEYEEAACKIVGTKDLKLLASGISIGARSHAKIKLEEAGVLDLWFEKVFKEEEQYKIGDWVSFYSETNKKLHTAKIRKLGSSYHYLSDGTEPFVHLLRKATEEEIAVALNKTVKLSIGKNVDIERDKLSNQVYILAEGKIIQYKHINNLYCNTNTFGDTNWKIQYNTFDIGCWKNVTRDDLRLILDAYEEINGKLE